MADEIKKAEEAKKVDEKNKTVVILNRGQRTFHVHTGKVLKPAVDEKPEELEVVKLGPGQSVEVHEKHAKDLLGYPDLQDAAKAAPAYADKLQATQEENERLKAELAAAKKGENRGK